jgi:Helix-hairpin-helix domain
MTFSRATAAGLVLGAAMFAADASAGLYWQQGVRSNSVSVCFVGDAVATPVAQVQQVLRYIREFEYAANVNFSAVATTCAASTIRPDGTDNFDGDIRVVLPHTSVAGTGLVPGNGCTMFRNAAGNYDGNNEGWGSWSNAPQDLAANRACLFNLKLGDEGDAGRPPYLNHTLHEFGHALGLSHEHLRHDVEKQWVIHYFKSMRNVDQTKAENIYAAGYRNLDEIAGATVVQLQKITGYGTAAAAGEVKMDATFLTHIAGVTVAIAETIYAAGFRTAGAVADATVTVLQTIPGYGALAAAQQLKNDAAAAPPRVIYGGGITNGFITAYDRASVMHYKFIDPGINGNYDYTGLSDLDRLSVHILYPEDLQVAEFVGTTVVSSAARVVLQSAWGVRGADLSFAAMNFEWKVAGTVRSTQPVLDVQLPAGTYSLQFAHRDFLGRSYSYTGIIRVLSPAAYAAQTAAVSAARLPLL